MKKILLSGIAIVLIASVAVYAQIGKNRIEGNPQLDKWEKLAERGDTAAMHRLIEFYDENSVEYVEVVAVMEPDGTEWTAEQVAEANAESKRQAEHSKEYSERLDYWLEKGLAIGDPVALATKGMRLYYDDKEAAIIYLSKAAYAGNAKAALLCGSTCLNQDKGDEAFKYLTKAYELGAPSAGWHLAICYSAGIGTEPDRDKAIEVMRHAAMLDYPEAISEMRRVEPQNEIWQHKADSLEIDFPDFPIIE